MDAALITLGSVKVALSFPRPRSVCVPQMAAVGLALVETGGGWKFYLHNFCCFVVFAFGLGVDSVANHYGIHNYIILYVINWKRVL